MNIILPSLVIFVPLLAALPCQKNATAARIITCSYSYRLTVVNGVTEKNETKALRTDDICNAFNKTTKQSTTNTSELCTRQKCGAPVVEEIPCQQYNEIRCA